MSKTLKKFHVKYIDQTTSKTVEKTITEREQYDLYKLQREGKVSIISIHGVSEGSEGNKKEISEDIEKQKNIEKQKKEYLVEALRLRKLRDEAWNRARSLPVGSESHEYNRRGKEYQAQIDKLFDAVLKLEEVPVAEPEVPETKVPEGVEVVKYTFVVDKDAEVAETMFDAITTGKYEFRSAVNIGTMVRCVMYEKGERVGTPVRMIVTDKDMAWHLQQLIDWCLRRQAKILATRREGKVLEVAFRMEGVKPPPPKEKLWYHFKKTDGWTLVSEEK